MKNFDNELALAVEKDADPEGCAAAGVEYALGMLQAQLPGFVVGRNGMTGDFWARRIATGNAYASDNPETLLEMCRGQQVCRQCGRREATGTYGPGYPVCAPCMRIMSQ